MSAQGAGAPEMSNERIAERLDEMADVLTEQDANPYRIQAYRRAADTMRRHPESIAQLAAERGIEGLTELAGIGLGLARSIHQLATTGELTLLERQRQESDPIEIIASVPGIGERTAIRIHDRLGIDTLEELEIAAHDGRLAQTLGLGPKRIAGIRDALATRLGRLRRFAGRIPHDEPGVAEVLDVDAEYLEDVRQGSLRRIAPRRFNPRREAWLPVLHTARGPRHYTALFSNTARAHELGRTSDWVVIFFDSETGERQFTVVTEERGRLAGRRVVRGRERECEIFYRGPRTPPGAASRRGAGPASQGSARG